MRAIARVTALVVVAGCATFEDPTIVLDLRVLGMQAEPPEVIIDVDENMPLTIDSLVDQLAAKVPIGFSVRALLAEPGRSGDIDWAMSACLLDRGGRCEEDSPILDFAVGVLPDPESNSRGSQCANGFNAEPGGVLCGELPADNRLVQLLFDALAEDVTGGLGGIDVGISLRATGASEAFAEKRVRFAPNIPLEKRANNNPHIDQLLFGQGGVGIDVLKAHCNDSGVLINRVRAGETITLFPVSRDGDKEEFVLPTLDGHSEHFTESLAYQWIASTGKFSDDETGGPPDVFGNVKLDGTEWTAPDDVTDTQRATIWVLQRDARYGSNWREACIEILPP